jgi:hypothetical protein
MPASKRYISDPANQYTREGGWLPRYVSRQGIVRNHQQSDPTSRPGPMSEQSLS